MITIYTSVYNRTSVGLCQWMQSYLYYLLCFYFTVLHIYFLYKCKVYSNLAWSKSTNVIFSIACTHFISLYHVWQFSQYFKLCHQYCACYGDLWSLIFHVTIVIVLGCHKLCPYKMVNSINKSCVCCGCSKNQPFPYLSSSHQASLCPDTQ